MSCDMMIAEQQKKHASTPQPGEIFFNTSVSYIQVQIMFK